MKKYNKRIENEVMGVIRLGLRGEENRGVQHVFTCHYVKIKEYWPDIDEDYLKLQLFLAINEITGYKGRSSMATLAMAILNKWDELIKDGHIKE